MGLFNFFNRNNKAEATATNNTNTSLDGSSETKEPTDKNFPLGSWSSAEGINQVYLFLQADYESKGYNDSLVNPDDSYKADNIRLIKLDLHILIEKTTIYYDNMISELNYHILTRTRAGLIDLVQELENKKKLVEDCKTKLIDIKNSLNDEYGMCQRIILSYQRGFMRGLSALTQSNILNKKI
jgi:hypothetical protein